jgi:hypothetical protein
MPRDHRLKKKEEITMGKKLYMDADADLGVIKDMTIAVVGYGTQGTARRGARRMGLRS